MLKKWRASRRFFLLKKQVIQSFFGCINSIKCFISYFAKIGRPISNMLKKDHDLNLSFLFRWIGNGTPLSYAFVSNYVFETSSMPLFPIMFLNLFVTTNLEYDETFPGYFWERFWLNHLDKFKFEEVERRSKEILCRYIKQSLCCFLTKKSAREWVTNYFREKHTLGGKVDLSLNGNTSLFLGEGN